MKQFSARMASFMGLPSTEELQRRMAHFEGLYGCTPAVRVQGEFNTVRGRHLIISKPVEAKVTRSGLQVPTNRYGLSTILLTGDERQQVTLFAAGAGK